MATNKDFKHTFNPSSAHYMSKGIPEPQAREMAAEIIKDKSKAHEILVKEELGINSEELKGSAMEAAVTSFLLFAVGVLAP